MSVSRCCSTVGTPMTPAAAANKSMTASCTACESAAVRRIWFFFFLGKFFFFLFAGEFFSWLFWVHLTI
jgi:hypothetical protein